MATLGQIPKPEAGQYKDKRKLFFVPTLLLPTDLPEDGRQLLDRFWSEVRDNIANLERSLGSVSCIFHEALYADGDAGLELLHSINPWGQGFIRALAQSNVRLEITEDVELMQEASDWQRCISVGLISEKVREMPMNGLQESVQRRYEHIASRVDEALKPDESGIMFLREDHKVQFPPDIQVFYISPPALNTLKQWFEDQMRQMAQQAAQQTQEQRAEVTESADGDDAP